MAELPALQIQRIGPTDTHLVERAVMLFDRAVDADATQRFLASDTHHLLVASIGGEPVGFVTGVETIHPDKGAEMMIYELGVAPMHRRRRVGTNLVDALRRLARKRGCYGMWVPIDAGDTIAIATYRAGGAGAPEHAAVMTWEL
ncbi:MAG TPA: GNAT family N-acetyltransferase [Acidimicrobiia bacterium]|nr:GNAT family N-acetyltransferase [Acidimicrobiia bacterium]